MCIHVSFQVLEDDKELLVDLKDKYFMEFVGMRPLGITIAEPSKGNTLYWLPASNDNLTNDEDCIDEAEESGQ